MSEPTPRVSLITTCKGRLGHLRQSLPKMVAQGDRCEVIVVDFDCPEGAGDWVHHQFAPDLHGMVACASATSWTSAAATRYGVSAPAFASGPDAG